MLRDEVIRYYYGANGYDYNCAEAMLHAADDYFHLNLPQEMFLGASGFGGGCFHDEMCGSLNSAITVLGLLYSVDGHGHQSKLLTQLEMELLNRFEERFHTTHCKQLKRENYIPVRKCENIIVVCADILEEIISKNPVINRR
ncbi:MAG: C-GCAxxG-C-C family protein [Erysipelotrichaceae bacterium]|nr:C-GCAxxG-C-C family protein [Erysipelotrichaceae bacterium]